MASTQHYVWAGGHFLLLISAFRYLMATIMFRTVSAWWYKASFAGALVSYLIVWQKSLGLPQPNRAWVRRALVDESIQYFMLALFWWSSKPVALALLPYAIFSAFHALTFVRTNLLPLVLPPAPPATAGGPPQSHPIAKKLLVWSKANYETGMKAVAYIDLLIMLRLVLGGITFQNSLISPLLYAHFLRQRYYQSAFTRDAIAVVDERIEAYIRKPGTPPMAVQVWDKLKMALSRWAGSVLTQQPAGARRG